METVIKKGFIVIGSLLLVILLVAILGSGIVDIIRGIQDFSKPGGKPIELIIEGFKSLSVIAVMYLLAINLLSKK